MDIGSTMALWFGLTTISVLITAALVAIWNSRHQWGAVWRMRLIELQLLAMQKRERRQAKDIDSDH